MCQALRHSCGLLGLAYVLHNLILINHSVRNMMRGDKKRTKMNKYYYIASSKIATFSSQMCQALRDYPMVFTRFVGFVSPRATRSGGPKPPKSSENVNVG